MSSDHLPPCKENMLLSNESVSLSDESARTRTQETADENWALQLLSDCESDKEEIKVEAPLNAQLRERRDDPKPVSRKLAIPGHDSFISSSDTEFNEFSLRLSAIENQFLTQAQNKQSNPAIENKNRNPSVMAKFKSFFSKQHSHQHD